MISEVTRIKLNLLYPDFRVRVYRIYEDVFLATRKQLNATETLRSFERQQKLYEVGRTWANGKWVVVNPAKRQTLTNAQPGFSIHAYGLAVDSAWAGLDPYLEHATKQEFNRHWNIYGKFIRAHGCVWGGDWNGNGIREPNDFDRPHCEMSYGLRVSELLEIYSNGGLVAVWSELDKIRGVPIASEWKIDSLTSTL